MEVLYREPTTIVAGDTATWTIKSADYPDYPTTTFDLKYFFAGSIPKNFIADKTSGDFVLTISATASAAMNVGSTDLYYKFIARFTDGTNSYTLREGQIKITPDLSSVAAGYEARDPDEQILAALEAMAAHRATRAEMTRSVNGKQIGYMTMKEIRIEILHFRELVARKRRERMRKQTKGRKVQNTIKFDLGSGNNWGVSQ